MSNYWTQLAQKSCSLAAASAVDLLSCISTSHLEQHIFKDTSPTFNIIIAVATFKLDFVPTYHHDTYDAISETNPDLSCEGKVVFVTGGGRGIGREIAKAFAVAGAKGIFIIGRTGTELLSAVKEIKSLSTGAPVSAHHAEADITYRGAVSSAFEKAISAFGHIDILIQNAGYLDAHRSLLDSDPDDYWKTFEINVKGGLLVTQQFLKQGQPGDTIINIGSGAGHLPPIPGYSAYSSSKLAFAKIIECVQLENPHLRVFNINPGAIATEMQKKSGDIATVDNIRLPASYCVWLAASKEADCLKGKFLWTNWDVTELLQRKDEIKEQNLLTHGLIGL